MASRFRSDHYLASNSGGKILRGRRHLQPFSPYRRSSPSAAPFSLPAPEPEARQSPRWFQGIISGATKLISSVLGSEGSNSSPSESSSDCSSDKEYGPYLNELEDHPWCDDLVEFNKRKSVVDRNVGSLAIVSQSESKLAIEQLLMQETFTRAEYNKMMEILRSRVIDSPSPEGGKNIQNEVPTRFSDKSSWQHLNKNRNIFGASGFSPHSSSAFSPRFYASEAVTPDLRNKVIMEAKKWFEEKKLSRSPICDQESGPCILNTDMNQYCFYDGDISPIEIGKSYMQSLPPWRSPSFNIGFKSSPSNRELSCGSSSHLLQASQENASTSGPHEQISEQSKTLFKKWGTSAFQSRSLEEDSRTFCKSIYNEQNFSNMRQARSTTRPLVLDPFRASSATNNSGNKAQGEHVNLHDKKGLEASHPMEMCKAISSGIIMDPHEAFNKSKIPNITLVNVSEHLNSVDVITKLPSDLDIPLPDENQIGSISTPKSSTALVNGGYFPVTGSFQPENGDPADPSMQKSYCNAKSQADNAMEVNFAFDSKHAHSFSDSRPAGNPHWQKDTIGTAEKSNSNGDPRETDNLNSEIESVSKGGPAPTDSSNGCCAVGTTHEHPSDVSSGKSRSENEQKFARKVLVEPTELGRGKRRAKKVVRQKRWKN